MVRGLRWSASGHVGWFSVVADGSRSLLLLENTMKRFGKIVARFVSEEQGTETLEWGLVCGLIVIGAIVAITAIGPKVTAMWNKVSAAVP
jgi:Flp pilus assembly pilin Flp